MVSFSFELYNYNDQPATSRCRNDSLWMEVASVFSFPPSNSVAVTRFVPSSTGDTFPEYCNDQHILAIYSFLTDRRRWKRCETNHWHCSPHRYNSTCHRSISLPPGYCKPCCSSWMIHTFQQCFHTSIHFQTANPQSLLFQERTIVRSHTLMLEQGSKASPYVL